MNEYIFTDYEERREEWKDGERTRCGEKEGRCRRPREVTWLKISLRCGFNFIFYSPKRNYNIFSATNTTDSVEKQQFADWLTWQTHEQRNQVLPERKERNFPSTQTSPTTQSSDFPRKLLCKHWKLTLCHILMNYCLMHTCKYAFFIRPHRCIPFLFHWCDKVSGPCKRKCQ